MNRHGGAALLLVLWLIALLTALIGAFALTSRMEALQGRVASRGAIAQEVARAGMEYALVRVSDQNPETRWLPNGRLYRWAFDGSEVQVRIIDETGKVDLNQADMPLLARLLQAVGAPPESSEQLAAAIVDWRDTDALSQPVGGAEDDDYAAAGRDYGAKDAPFETLAEIEQVLGMTPELYAAVSPHLTLFSGRAQPDATYATAPVLVAMGMDAEAWIGQRNAAGVAGASQLVGAGSGTYSIESRARLADGRQAAISTVVRAGASPVPGSAYTLLRWEEGSVTTMSSMRDSLQHFRARLGPGPRSFLAWWSQALASWLPARWRVLLGLTRDRLLFQHDGDELRMSWQEGLQRHPLALLPDSVTGTDLRALLSPRLADLPRWWLLPAGAVLRRRLLLPAAAAERLRDVVRFEIDRQTPFRAEDVCFDARVIRRREDGQLEAELVTVPRAGFDAGLTQLGALAPELAGADVADADGLPLGVNLLPLEARASRQTSRRGLHVVLAAVMLVSLVLGAWLILDNRRAAAEAFATQVASRAEQARRVSTQRQQLVDLVAGATALNKARADRPTTVEVIDEVTRRLPDNTYLEKLSIEGDRLMLIGFSPEASGLVAKLEGSPLWRSPALSGALQPDPRTRLDRFTLTAELAGSQKASAPAPASSPGDADGAGRD